MKPIQLFPLNTDAIAELDELYRTTRDVRVRTRAQMILLAGEQPRLPHEIATIVRKDEQTVRRWLKRYMAEGINGLDDAPRTGTSGKVTPPYQKKLIQTVRQRPRSLGQAYSLWALQRLADYMAEETGIRVEAETVRLHLKAAEIVLSRPQHKVSSPDPEYEIKKDGRRKPQPAKSRGCLLLCR